MLEGGRAAVSGEVARVSSVAQGSGVVGSVQAREDGRGVVKKWMVGER